MPGLVQAGFGAVDPFGDAIFGFITIAYIVISILALA